MSGSQVYDPSDYQFVDTNILVYAHDTTAGSKHTQAKELIQTLWESKRGCLSIQVLQEFYVTITRKVAKPLAPDQASFVIGSLGTWYVHRPSVYDIQNAIILQERYQISLWDAMIIHSAVSLDCGLVWSEDLNAGQIYETVRVLDPFRLS